MSKSSRIRKVERILHPSDFTEGSEVAFAHALKFAMVADAKLNVLHASGDDDTHWSDFPGVRDILERWGMLPPGSGKEDVARLGVKVGKVMSPQEDPVRACLAFLDNHPTDLIVLSTHRHEGKVEWLHKSVAEPLARESGEMTLFIPRGLEGFVSRDFGTVSLKNILIPIDSSHPPQAAIDAAVKLGSSLNCSDLTITLLHVGEDGDMPSVTPAEQEGWTWERLTRPGDPVEVILKTASEASSDLIVMMTGGHHGFLDALRGSTTERVLHGDVCPVLVIPTGPQSSS